MSHGMSSSQAAAYLIDPLNAPEPSAETGPGSHFRSTYGPAPTTVETPTSKSPLGSNNPFRDESSKTPPGKESTVISERRVSRGSPSGRVSDYRSSAFSGVEGAHRRSGSIGREPAPPSYDVATSPSGSPKGAKGHHRRSSSLKERYPGDDSHMPLDIIRRDSKKAFRSPHLKKHHIPGPDLIDRLDPAVGGRAYHHEGPYDATLLARNNSYTSSPVAALETSNTEALKATPAENIKDALERHKPLDGVAALPPGVPDRFGRTYNYEEGADLLREGGAGADGPGYKRWADKEYSPDDLDGKAEPAFSLDRALQAHKIDDEGIELADHSQISRDYKAAKRSGTLDSRDPVVIAGDDGKYVDMEIANSTDTDVKRTGSLRAAGASLKKRIGSLRHRKADE